MSGVVNSILIERIIYRKVDAYGQILVNGKLYDTQCEPGEMVRICITERLREGLPQEIDWPDSDDFHSFFQTSMAAMDAAQEKAVASHRFQVEPLFGRLRYGIQLFLASLRDRWAWFRTPAATGRPSRSSAEDQGDHPESSFLDDKRNASELTSPDAVATPSRSSRWQPNHKTSRFFDIKNCARCSADHNHLEFFHFTRKTTIDFVEYHYWTLCPILREPILMSIKSDTDASPEVQS